jgi:hypothetical protein
LRGPKKGGPQLNQVLVRLDQLRHLSLRAINGGWDGKAVA